MGGELMRYARTCDPEYADERQVLRIEPFHIGGERPLPAAVLTEHDSLVDAVAEGWSTGISLHRLDGDGALLRLGEGEYEEASRLALLSPRELMRLAEAS